MKPLIRLAILFFISAFFVQPCFAQDDMVSTFKPKTNTEKLVIAKLKALPEIKEFYAYVKRGKPDIMINPPDKSQNDYRFQVGISYPDIFRTHFWIWIDPKSLQVYYEDYLDESGSETITLQRWRHWRSKPEFNDLHKWANGKLVVIKIKPHVQKKSSHT
ncbi:MAG: hypothetical protein ACXVJG_06670 [Mucilaginibacter sp.]